MNERGDDAGVARRGDDVVGGRVLGDERRGAGLQRAEELLVAAYIVSTTMPSSGWLAAELRHQVEPVPSGSRTSVTTTSAG